MRISLNPQSQAKNTYKDIRSFSEGVDNAEATYIACEFFLSTFKFADLPKVLSLVLSKVRIGGRVLISDYDWNSIADQIYRGTSLEDINNTLFNSEPKSMQKETSEQSKVTKIDPILKSCLAIEEVEKYIPDNFAEIHKQFYRDTFILTLERKS